MGSFLPRHWSLWRDCHAVDSYLPFYDYHYCSQSRTCLWDSGWEKEEGKTRDRKEKIEKRNAVGKRQHDAMRRKVEIQHKYADSCVARDARAGSSHQLEHSHYALPASLNFGTKDFIHPSALGGKLIASWCSRLLSLWSTSPLAF